MGPVDYTTTVIPFITAAHSQRQILARRYTPGKIDIMRDHNGVTIIQFQYELLMPRALVIITQHTTDMSTGFKPNA